jgi:hypothetical protein
MREIDSENTPASRNRGSQDFVDTPSLAFQRGFEYFRAHTSEVTVKADVITERLDVFGNVLRRELSILENPFLNTRFFSNAQKTTRRLHCPSSFPDDQTPPPPNLQAVLIYG